MAALVVELDHAQARLTADRLTAFADAPLFNPFAPDTYAELSGVTFEPVGKRLILEPYCLTDAWYTTSTGNYAKLGLSSFASTTGWEERADQHAKGPFVARPDGTAGTLLTSSAYSKNQGFYVAVYVPGAGDTYIAARCGWNSSASTAGGVALELASDGTINVFSGGVAIGQGKISGAKTTSDTSNTLIELVVLPLARREIVIFSPSQGDGFSVIVPGIDETTSDPIILPAQKFWLQAVAGATQFQVAPLKFPTSGTATSDRLSLLEPPATGEAFVQWDNVWPSGLADYAIWGYQAFVGTQSASAALRKWDGTGFTADGTQKNIRLRLTLTTDNQGFTPVVYGGMMAYSRQLTDTPSSAVAITSRVLECTLSVPEDPAGAVLDMTVRDPAGLGVPKPSILTNRPARAKIGTVTLFDGLTGDVPRVWTANPAADTIDFEVQSRLKLLDEYVFPDPFPVDSYTLGAVIQYLAALAFRTSEMDISTAAFRIPFEGAREGGEWGSLIEVGDTALGWIQRLVETYAGNWYWGVRPSASGVKFYLKSPADLGTTPKITLYETSAAAISAGVSSSDVLLRTVRDLTETYLEPIANDVRITGVDPRTGRPFQSYKEDTASKNPATAVGSRPDNWKGSILRFGLVDPAITTQTLCDDVCTEYFARLSRTRRAVQFRSDLLKDTDGIPLWRGDVVRIQDRGDFRIESFGCQFVYEYSDGLPIFRDALYTGDEL